MFRFPVARVSADTFVISWIIVFANRNANAFHLNLRSAKSSSADKMDSSRGLPAMRAKWSKVRVYHRVGNAASGRSVSV